jgi:glycosyltransferase involved in cell wall biosynthesis
MDVSVIIPTYNRLWCLPKAIDSCRNTQCKTEIIVVDDGSTDGTWEWLLTQKDIVSIRQDNWGKCWAANKGFDAAKGKYIRFLDSDDYLIEGSIDGQFDLLVQTGADVSVAGYKFIDNKGNLIRNCDWIYCDDFIAQQMGECDSSHYSAYLFKKSFVSDIPHRPDFAYRDDRLFVIEMAIKQPKIAVYSLPTFYHVHHHNERLQFNYDEKSIIQNIQHLNLYKKVITKLALSGNLTQRRKNAACNVLWPLAHWIAKTHIKEAYEVVKWIYELNPDFKIPETGSLGILYNKFGFLNTIKILLEALNEGNIKYFLPGARS